MKYAGSQAPGRPPRRIARAAIPAVTRKNTSEAAWPYSEFSGAA